jgi:hypothetical protein
MQKKLRGINVLIILVSLPAAPTIADAEQWDDVRSVKFG